MKRAGRILRKKPLARAKWLKRSTKKIPKINKAAARRKLARYKAYMASPEWKAKREECLRLAGYRCTNVVDLVRCPTTTTLSAHHLTYARFTRELPTTNGCRRTIKSHSERQDRVPVCANERCSCHEAEG